MQDHREKPSWAVPAKHRGASLPLTISGELVPRLQSVLGWGVRKRSVSVALKSRVSGEGKACLGSDLVFGPSPAAKDQKPSLTLSPRHLASDPHFAQAPAKRPPTGIR